MDRYPFDTYVSQRNFVGLGGFVDLERSFSSGESSPRVGVGKTGKFLLVFHVGSVRVTK